MKKRAPVLITTGLLLIPLVLLASLYIPFPSGSLNPDQVISLRLLDRNGDLLREVLSGEEGRCTWIFLDEMSPNLLKATVAAEDRSFFVHPGINVFSILRALKQNMTEKRIVSGASTITQQLVRNLFHYRRTLVNKTLEAWQALRLEKKLTKEEILVQYINRISYGNQAFGIEAAAQLYFDKSARDLSLAESAFLAGLPRAPSLLNPFKTVRQAKIRQQDILLQMLDRRDISRPEYSRALAQPLPLTSAGDKFRAPHFCDYILGSLTAGEKSRLKSIRTTLDGSIQNKVEILARNHIKSLALKNITNAAVVVMDNRTDSVLAMLGSVDFFDASIGGQVNGAVALRQPGSALKPFTYGLALEQGKTAASLIDDRPINFNTPTGSYRPMNYDRTFHGPTRIRTALACSYNVPAVSLLETIGPDLLYRRLKESGFESLTKPPSFYGIGLTLGNAEVTLMELVQAYAALARGGVTRRSRIVNDFVPDGSISRPDSPAKRIFSREVAYILTDILSDSDARIPAFGYFSPLNLPFPCAAKTGTTKDYRDNWTIGWTKKYTVGVWVGNFNGEPMHNVSGISGCGPLFKDIMLFLEEGAPSGDFPVPDSLVKKTICPESGKLVSENCPGSMEEIFIPETIPDEICQLHGLIPSADIPQTEAPASSALKILVPVSGDVFKIDPELRRDYQVIRFRARVPSGSAIQSIEWWMDGRCIAETPPPFELSWNIKPGDFRIKITRGQGDSFMESPPVRFSVLR